MNGALQEAIKQTMELQEAEFGTTQDHKLKGALQWQKK